MGIWGNYKMKIIKQIPILIIIAWIFFIVSFSTAQQQVIQKTKPGGVFGENKSAVVKPRVFKEEDLKEMKLSELKDNYVIEIKGKRMSGAEAKGLIRRKLKVSDPTDPVEVARALQNRYKIEQHPQYRDLARSLDSVAGVLLVLMGEAGAQIPQDTSRQETPDNPLPRGGELRRMKPSAVKQKDEKPQITPEQPQPVTGQQMQKLPKPTEGLKPVKNLTITNVSMDEVATGAHFRIRFSVSQKGSCKIVTVLPEVKIKAEDGRTYEVRDRLCDVYNKLGYIRLSCDELRGGEGKYEYCGIFADKGAVWNQIGICLVIDEPGLSTTECTWYPLGTKPYYFLQQN